MLRHGCRNLVENKIKVEGIYHDKRFAQSKAGQEPMCQSLQQHHFAYNFICKQNVGYNKEGRTETGYNTEDYRKIHTENFVAWIYQKQSNLGAEWNEGHDCGILKAQVSLGWICSKVHRPVQLLSGIWETGNNYSKGFYNNEKTELSRNSGQNEEKDKIENEIDIYGGQPSGKN